METQTSSTALALIEHERMKVEKMKREKHNKNAGPTKTVTPVTTDETTVEPKKDGEDDNDQDKDDEDSASSYETDEESQPRSKPKKYGRRWLSPYEYAKKMNFGSNRWKNYKRYDEPRSFVPRQKETFNDRWRSNNTNKSWSYKYQPRWNNSNQRRSSASYSSRPYKDSYNKKPYRKPYRNFGNRYRSYKSR